MRGSSVHQVRIKVPRNRVVKRLKATDLFDVLPNNQGITEEYLYAHQPVENGPKIAVYSTNPTPVGHLDDSQAVREEFSVLEGPVIVVARKGYAGKLFVVRDEALIVHEDAYAMRPAAAFAKKLNLDWFAGHFSFEFQALRTSIWGIGDFPRERMRLVDVELPDMAFQEECAALYARRDRVATSISALRSEAEARVLSAAT